MIKCKHSTGLFFTSFYTNQVNSLTSVPHEPIVLVHQATRVANHLHKTCKRDIVNTRIQETTFFKSGKIGSCIVGYLQYWQFRLCRFLNRFLIVTYEGDC